MLTMMRKKHNETTLRSLHRSRESIRSSSKGRTLEMRSRTGEFKRAINNRPARPQEAVRPVRPWPYHFSQNKLK